MVILNINKEWVGFSLQAIMFLINKFLRDKEPKSPIKVIDRKSQLIFFFSILGYVIQFEIHIDPFI